MAATVADLKKVNLFRYKSTNTYRTSKVYENEAIALMYKTIKPDADWYYVATIEAGVHIPCTNFELDPETLVPAKLKRVQELILRYQELYEETKKP